MKGAHWLGFGTDNIIQIATNEFGQMDLKQLAAGIQREKDSGRYPVMVNATAGTTVLGAIDDMDAIADVCQKHGIWMHVDVRIGSMFNRDVQ